MVVMDVIAGQVAEVQRRYPDARIEQSTDGQRVLIVPGVTVGVGWTMNAVTLRVLIPAGYPHVHPDCFYTEAQLLLASGGDPSNSSIQHMFGAQYRWFSWHVTAWAPENGTLDQYVRFCQRRLKEAR